MPESNTIAARHSIERDIVGRVVDALLAAGYLLSVDNGGDEDEIEPTTDRAAVLGAMFATDEEWLNVWMHRPHAGQRHLRPHGEVYLVYGNDGGHGVVNDYTGNLDGVLQPVIEYANSIANDS